MRSCELTKTSSWFMTPEKVGTPRAVGGGAPRTEGGIVQAPVWVKVPPSVVEVMVLPAGAVASGADSVPVQALRSAKRPKVLKFVFTISL